MACSWTLYLFFFRRGTTETDAAALLYGMRTKEEQVLAASRFDSSERYDFLARISSFAPKIAVRPS
eukprot:2043869-Amphidinium_carterae.1